MIKNAIIGQSFTVTHKCDFPIDAASKIVIKYFRPRRAGTGELAAIIDNSATGEFHSVIPANLNTQLGLWRFIAIVEFSESDIYKSDSLKINIVSEGESID